MWNLWITGEEITFQRIEQKKCWKVALCKN